MRLEDGRVGMLLTQCGLEAPAGASEKFQQHLALVRLWNRVGGFVSAGDLDVLENHVLDSLSLAPYISVGKRWLDIGSGGGFPAMPVAVLCPEIDIVCIERSRKKAGLLLTMAQRLGLPNLSVEVGVFPESGPPWMPDVVTARAVERPESWWPSLAKWVQDGATFLCQRDPTWWRERMFHVEHLDDEWVKAGLRRGALYRITAPTS